MPNSGAMKRYNSLSPNIFVLLDTSGTGIRFAKPILSALVLTVLITLSPKYLVYYGLAPFVFFVDANQLHFRFIVFRP